MSVTVVNDYKIKKDGDKEEAMSAAARLVEDFLSRPGVQLSLWLEDQDDPLHHFHITVFNDEDTFEAVKSSQAITDFIERFYPHMDQSTHVAPLCDVLLANGHGVQPVEWTRR